MVDGRPVAAEHNGHHHPNARPTKRTRGASPPPNGTESTPAKRSRVSRACDQCRASREKCDGVKPVCHTCDTQKRTCTYDEPPKKRGIQPNYIRTLELTLAWLFQSVPETQTALARSLPIVNGPAQRSVILSARNSIVHADERVIACKGCLHGFSVRSQLESRWYEHNKHREAIERYLASFTSLIGKLYLLCSYHQHSC